MKKSIIIAGIILLLLSGCDSLNPSSETENTPPVANAGDDQNVMVGETVELDGSGSSDLDEDPLTHHWSIISSPEGSIATLSDSNVIAPTFVPDVEGSYTVELIVNDGTDDSTADYIIIMVSEIVANTPPVANAGDDQNVMVGETVELDGSGSSDLDEDPLTHHWSIISSPEGSIATLSDSDVIAPNFVPDVEGSYIVELIVNDGTDDSTLDSLVITASALSDQPLELLQMESLDGYRFRLTFNKELNVSLAENPSNYALTYWEWAMTVSTAEVESSGKGVILTTDESQCPDIEYTVEVQNVEDLYGNVIETTARIQSCLGQTPVGTANWGHEDNLILQGSISYEDGSPAEGISYHIHNRGPDGFYDETHKDDVELYVKSDSNGQFVLQGLADQSEYAQFADGAWFDSYWDTPEGYERMTRWPSIPIGQNSITMDYTLYEIQPGTVLEGYILDNYGNPIEIDSEVTWMQGVCLWRGEVMINEGGFVLDYPDPEGEYYYNQSTGYYRITGLAGGDYTLNGGLTEGYTTLPDTVVNLTPGVTTQQDFVIYKKTGNDKLSIQLNTPAEAVTPSSSTSFSWDFTNHSVAHCYTLGIWSADHVLQDDGIVSGDGLPNVLFIGMPVSTDSVDISFGVVENSIGGTDYRLYNDTNAPLTSGETYYWGVFSYDGQYQELNFSGDYNGEPSGGLRSFTAP